MTPLRIGIVGCGDVFHRSYLPVLRQLAPTSVTVNGCCDIRPDAAERAAAAFRELGGNASAFTDHRTFIDEARIDAAFNLTPAPQHGAVSEDLIEAGIHVFSEKPLANTLEEADRLIDAAGRRGLTLMCAPAVAATQRFRWLADVISSGRLGTPTLVTATYGDMGPAAWREYSGDPRVFFSTEVGPLLDQGVYALHGMTSLMGPARAVQVMGGITIPRRIVRGHMLTGTTIEVKAPDHFLVQLDFGGNRYGQLLSSYAVPGTRSPWMEIHCTRGTVSIPNGGWEDANGPVDIFLDDESPLGIEGWITDVRAPEAQFQHMIATGPLHFIACLRGEEAPLLTAEHARHVLEIVLKARESLADGTIHPIQTAL